MIKDQAVGSSESIWWHTNHSCWLTIANPRNWIIRVHDRNIWRARCFSCRHGRSPLSSACSPSPQVLARAVVLGRIFSTNCGVTMCPRCCQPSDAQLPHVCVAVILYSRGPSWRHTIANLRSRIRLRGHHIQQRALVVASSWVLIDTIWYACKCEKTKYFTFIIHCTYGSVIIILMHHHDIMISWLWYASYYHHSMIVFIVLDYHIYNIISNNNSNIIYRSYKLIKNNRFIYLFILLFFIFLFFYF